MRLVMEVIAYVAGSLMFAWCALWTIGVIRNTTTEIKRYDTPYTAGQLSAIATTGVIFVLFFIWFFVYGFIKAGQLIF